MTEYLFDLKLNAALRVTARSEAEARLMIAEIDAFDLRVSGLGVDLSGECSLADLDSVQLAEINGNEVPAEEPSATDIWMRELPHVAIEGPDNAELAGDYGLGEELADMSVLSEPEARAASTESHRPPWDVAATRVTGARVFLSALRDDPIADLAEIVSPNISEAKRSMSHGAQLMEFAGKNLAVGVKDVLSSAADLIEEAMSVHIYDADQGEEPEPDCPYTAMVKRLRYFAGQL